MRFANQKSLVSEEIELDIEELEPILADALDPDSSSVSRLLAITLFGR